MYATEEEKMSNSENDQLSVNPNCAEMTLRDWLAGQAICGLLSTKEYGPAACAQLAYDIADFMMRKRNEK